MPRKIKRLKTSTTSEATDDKIVTKNKKEVNNKIDKENEVYDNHRLGDNFFDTPCIDLAKRLLGKYLVRKTDDGTLIKGKIVETESYPGGDDKGSCSYNGKETPKNRAVFMKPGTAFVYMTYGMYHCINLSSQGHGSAVLLRAVEPTDGIEKMTKYRQEYNNKNGNVRKFKSTDLCSGPSKLCIAFNVTKSEVNEKDFSCWNEMWVENNTDIDDKFIVKTKRIGIDFVGEPYASNPLRFYVYDNPYVSHRVLKEEKLIEEKLKNN